MTAHHQNIPRYFTTKVPILQQNPSPQRFQECLSCCKGHNILHMQSDEIVCLKIIIPKLSV